MGIFDKAKDLAREHSTRLDAGVDQAADIVDDKTGLKYSEHIDRGAETAKDKLADYLRSEE